MRSRGLSNANVLGCYAGDLTLVNPGRPVLYLGFGGVLHVGAGHMTRRGSIVLDTGRQPFEFAPLLCDILRPFPLVQLVLSCGWIDTFGETVTQNFLPAELRERVVGTTLSFDNGLQHLPEGHRRVLRVLRHAHSARASRWLALDVCVSAAPVAFWQHFVVTRAEVALGSTASQQQLSTWLKENETGQPSKVTDSTAKTPKAED